ncbi:FtsX-like permease family protein [Sinomicrobium pectinilyticum]|uniref:FtsX-like permease family protein n=1 Tax=Sinomicrobium pectinilyticum TaxID=1084421 RepID=A0A3N0E5Z3_SINP1|nr:FtsX-like permease family protein [Sinomicrobium pectinilyticum]RNL83262.1 FtsX-like permease family protein [Sinomicrobium pectinilyticum]
MHFPIYIAKRYLASKSSQNAVNIINLVTFLVVVIGAAALFIVLSGFAGLKTFSLSFSNSFDPDLKVMSDGQKFMTLNDEQKNRLKNIPEIAFFSREIEEQVLLTHQQKNHVALIKGTDTTYARVVNTDSILYYGNWFDRDLNEVVTGIGTASLLGLALNDYMNPLRILVPKPGKGSITSNTTPYNEVAVTVSGVYAVTEDLDKKYVFADLELVQKILHKEPSEITAINIKLVPGANVSRIKQEITGIFESDVMVKDRVEQNDALYRMLNTENMATYLIFTLVLIIALFNVVGAIIMMILDKRKNLNTLFSMGATVKRLRRIFFVQGLMVTLVGGSIGIALGVLLTWSQMVFGWLLITPSLPYPVEIHLANIGIVFGTIAILGLIASKIASGRISEKLIQDQN